MVGHRQKLAVGLTMGSALGAAVAAWICAEASLLLAAFFLALVVASVAFSLGCRWTLSAVVAGNRLATGGRQRVRRDG